MPRLLLLFVAAVLLSACIAPEESAPAPAPEPTIEAPAEWIIDISESQDVDGVTVDLASLVYMPHDGDMLEALDPGGHSYLLDGFPYVGYIDVSVANASGAPVDIYPATFGYLVVDGEQIDLVSYQFFAKGDAIKSVFDGASKRTDIWFPLTDSQFAALQSGAPVKVIFTDGTKPVFTFEING